MLVTQLAPFEIGLAVLKMSISLHSGQLAAHQS